MNIRFIPTSVHGLIDYEAWCGAPAMEPSEAARAS